ncbi:MAG: xanthine dehydrogenase family protein molybdopterin-binding subunit [Parvibaculaceae bacterium]
MAAGESVRFGAGHSLPRLEDERLITGRATFVDDVKHVGELHLAILRSPHAHARILSIDVAAARAADGVVAVLTGDDLAASGVRPIPILRHYRAPDGSAMATPPRWLLARERVRHVGEPVVAVVAMSRHQAESALTLIAIDFELLPHLAGIGAALADGAPLIWPPAGSNSVVMERFGSSTKVDAAFAHAAHRVALSVRNQRLFAAPLEPRGASAVFETETGRVVLHAASQNPTAVHHYLAEHVLGWPAERLRIMVADIGGGFGMKGYLYPEDALVAYLAFSLQRPVRWMATRSEDFLGSTHARDQEADAVLALDAEGRITALRVRLRANLGAYPAPSGPLVALVLGAKVATNVYAIPEIDIEAVGVLTNMQATAPYRGAGRPEAIYLIERLVDAAAVQTGIDRVELRRRNLVRPEQMPYRAATGEVYDSGDFPELLERALAESDWHGFEERQRDSGAAGLLRGRGLSLFVEWTGAQAFKETVDVTVAADGRITVVSATIPMGQGLETTFAQMAAAVFGVDPASVKIVTGDTDRASGFGSFGSRSLFVGGSAVALGAEAALDACRKTAAEHLEVAADDLLYEKAQFRVVGTDRTVGLFELMATLPKRRLSLGFTNEVASGSWPNGAHVCEVEIDPETGFVRLDRYLCVDDVGVVINPMIVEGQIQGGVAQGVGQALWEAVVHDPETGQLLTATFQDYAMPRALDLPMIRSLTDERWPCLTNPLGSKGAGESGTVGAPPAVISAILDALRSFGVTTIDMPATPERIWRAMQQEIDRR